MHRRLDKLSAKAAGNLRRELQQEFRSQLAEQAAAVRKRAVAEAHASSERQLATLQQKLDASQSAAARAVQKAVRESDAIARSQLAVLKRKLDAAEGASQASAKKAAKEAATETARMARKDFDLLKQQAAKERARNAAETARLKSTVDDLSRKLERQTSEQLGEMTEADAFAALRRAFPHDDIQRIDRGVRGADILHKVVEDGTEVGRIVYECKNASAWQNEWLNKARSYRSEYQTQWVVIASRCFPRKEKSFIVERGVPVIELRLLVKLAEVIRTAIVEIGSLRLTGVGRQAKADQLFEYVLSDHFVSRFKGIAEAVAALRVQQDRERQWHSEAWAKEGRLYDDVDGGRREIAAQLRAIAEAPGKTRLRVLAGKR